MEAVFKNDQVVLHRTDVCEEHLLPEWQEWTSRVEQKSQPHSKEEDEGDLEEFPLNIVVVKIENDEVECESEEKREAEPPSSSSTQHITTEDHCGGSQTDKLLAPLSDSDDATSHSPDTDDEDSISDVQQRTGQQACLPQPHRRTSNLRQEELQLPHFKAEGEEPQPLCIKEEEEELQPPCVKEEEKEPLTDVKEEAEEPQPPHIKKEEERNWITEKGECLLGQEEADLTKFPLTVKTEDKPHESSQLHHSQNIQQLIGRQEDPQPPHIKEEEEELWITQEGECLLGQEEADLTKFPLTVVSVKTEDHEEKPPESSQLHHSPSEENKAVERPSRSSPKHMTTEADGDHCSGLRADNLLAPLSDSDETSHDNVNKQLHTRTHAGEKLFSCSVCTNVFFQSCDFTRHMRTHTGEKPFRCSVCAKRFSIKSNMQKHMRTHTGEKPFICSVCSKTFSIKSNMQTHMRTHTGEKPFRCSVCSKRFFDKQKMQIHMRKHTGEKPFSCSVCGKRFSSKSNMKTHTRTHTGEKHFSCSVCNKRFPNTRNMQIHMRTHTVEKPIYCSVCSKGFSVKSKMQIHMRKHTGEKPYSCLVCSKTFSNKSNMKTHMRTHTGEKPYRCSICAKGYARNCGLTRHLQTHTEEKPIFHVLKRQQNTGGKTSH
ncbi:zinc finger protein 79-like isoform X2 [Entelurus aequoreus]|uniref:zinc finger protein 79-like isoform X2 n=1 Tax=Entelurus aequoreus TaxID=161455 RepID=UPI002B1E6EFC|nr:zinc finger protein 79-like isoform X2 [Entelurus aequoreus]